MLVDNIATADGFTVLVTIVEDLVVEKLCVILDEAINGH